MLDIQFPLFALVVVMIMLGMQLQRRGSLSRHHPRHRQRASPSPQGILLPVLRLHSDKRISDPRRDLHRRVHRPGPFLSRL